MDVASRVRGLAISSARRVALADVRRKYDTEPGPSDIERVQCQLFNAQWRHALAGSEFYRFWRDEHDLPDAIQSVADIQSFPPLTKRVLRDREDLVFAESSRDVVYATGGTTAEPTIFPRSESEATSQWADNYVGRAWWGIQPTDRSVLVWGHSHLYGSGWRRVFRRGERAIKDSVTGTLRLDGYRVSQDDSRDHVRRLLDYSPNHVIGYSSALTRMAQAAQPRDIRRLHELRLQGVIATAETLDEHDETLIRRVFGAPVIIEYGSAELGILAMSRGTSRDIRVLWGSHLVTQNATDGVIVTTLKSRQFPLINYALGDRVRPTLVSDGGSILSLSHVEGRTLDLLTVAGAGDAITVSALQFTHILKGHPGVHAVQFAQIDSTHVRVYLELQDGVRLPAVEAHFWPLLVQEYPGIRREGVSLVIEPDQLRSRAGKHLVMRPAPRQEEGEVR